MTEADFCAAYGCPMLGSFGIGSRWYCACHFRAPVAAHNAITSVLVQNRTMADRAVSARRSGTDCVREIEDRLVDLTHEIGREYSVTSGGVKGPTRAEPHYSEPRKMGAE